MKFKYVYSILAFVLLSCQNATYQTVTVKDKKLLVEGQPYRINGICYSRGGAGNYTDDIVLLKEANINTIRVYNAIKDTAELNAFHNAGIKIIMHLHENDFESYVEEFRNHPVILMWEFGNEFNYHTEWFEGDIQNWYSKLQACALRVKQLDPDHPVSTAHGEVPDTNTLNFCSAIDIWGLNLYRWDNNTPAILDFVSKSNKAMYVSEAGGDSYNKKTNTLDEAGQAKATEQILKGILSESDHCLGVTLFEFCDEWWKSGQEDIQNPGGSAPNSSGVPYDGSADEEYWGIVRQDRTRKPAFDVVKDIYSSAIQVE